MYKASIHVTLRPSILDPQGKTTHHALEDLGFQKVDRVRMGKFIEMWIEESTKEAAEAVAQRACEQLLANPVMEDYEIRVEKAPEQVAT
ncbi:MAG: phosphoribosylformylglycinamidine synthase subunit PurS [Rhodothermales bacterium]